MMRERISSKSSGPKTVYWRIPKSSVSSGRNDSTRKNAAFPP